MARMSALSCAALALAARPHGSTAAALMSFEPWAGADFGGAGDVSDDLQDAAFVVDPGGC
jgi:hypothetical protein